MKKILLTSLLLLALLPVKAQVGDTAARIVDRYEHLLNVDALPNDSMVYVRSVVTRQDAPDDSTIMLRFTVGSSKFRAEVRDAKGRMLDGVISDGDKFFRYWDDKRDVWRSCQYSSVLEVWKTYDIRGPLYHWRTIGAEPTFKGELITNGQPIYQVDVACPSFFDRQYFFEKESGLLLLFKELPHTLADTVNAAYRVDWHMYHEYQRLGNAVLPKVESYQYGGHVYIIRHTVKFMPVDNRLFTQENK